MRIVAAVTDPASIRRYLEGTGQSAEVDCGRPLAVLLPTFPGRLHGLLGPNEAHLHGEDDEEEVAFHVTPRSFRGSA